jgi:hypothetical protein
LRRDLATNGYGVERRLGLGHGMAVARTPVLELDLEESTVVEE